MGSTVLDSALYRDTFGTPAMRGIFEDAALLTRYTEVEVALARAQGRLGVIPQPAAQDIAAKCNSSTLDLARLKKETETVGYPILPLVHQLADAVRRGGQVPCTGARPRRTSWTPRWCCRCATRFDADRRRTWARCARSCCASAKRYRDTPMAGRTHLQQALPVTFGYKARDLARDDRPPRRAARAAEAARAGRPVRRRRRHARLARRQGPRCAEGPDAGAAARAARRHLARRARRASPRRSASSACVTGSLGKIAFDVMLMASTEVGEVFEPFVQGRGASSTMPQKRNPISCELILAAAKAVRQHAGLMLDAHGAGPRARDRPLARGVDRACPRRSC